MIGGWHLDEVGFLDDQSGHLEREDRRKRPRCDGLKILRSNRIRVEIAVLKN